MLDAFYIAATGMHAQQQNVDAVANNLANVNTPGFKKSRVTFFDLVTRDAERALATNVNSAAALLDIAPQKGAGVGVAAIHKLFEAGDIKKTDSIYDLAIAGDGFLEVSLPDGTTAYTRGGSLRVNAEGLLSTMSGHSLRPGISIPEGAQNLLITLDGRVTVQMTGQSSPVEIGRLQLVRFANAAGLTGEGDNLYRATPASGEAIAGRGGDDGMGTLRQGHLEGSNVKMVEEMVNLMVAQRAYEASSKVIQASDELLGMINNLRR
jgi:flagellar basal-body rod protein FlgG